MTRGWISAGLFAVAGAAAFGVQAAEKHCQLQSYGEIPASFEDSSVITEAQIDGKPVRLIVDTGGFGTLLFENQARKLGLVLRHTDATSYGVGGASNVFSARVKEFRLGNLSDRDADLVVTGQSLGAAQGILGAKFLLQSDVEFDLPHGKIRFFKPRDCTGDEVVYWGQAYAVAPLIPMPDDRLVVRVRVNDTPIVAQMDTGASTSVLTPAAAATAGVSPGSAALVAEGRMHGMGAKAVDTYAGKFASFSFGEETIKNAELRVADLFHADKERETGDLIATSVTNEPQMLLGADFFRSHRVFVALSQHKVYASYQGGPVFRAPSPPPRTDVPAKP